MKWDSAWKVLQISDYKGETAKPKPFIKGMLETINQSYFYIESLTVKNFSRGRQRPQSASGTLQEYWYDVSFQLNPGKVEIAVFIHNLRKYDAHHIPLESRIVSQTTLGEDWRHSEKFASQTTLGEETNVFQQISSSRTAASLRQRPLASCWVSLDCNKPKIPSGNVTKNFEVLKQYESDKKNLSSLWENASAHTVNGQFGTGFEPIKLLQTERRGNQRLRSRAIMGSCSDINLYK